MQNIWARWILLAGATLALAGPAGAAETPPAAAPAEVVAVRFEVLQVNDATAAALRARSLFPGGYKGDRGHTLQSSELMVITGKASLFAFGRKYPITYYDPRSSQFQVQYVDTGMKIDVTVSANGGEGYRLENYDEFAATEKVRTAGTPVVSAYPQTNVFLVHNDKSGVHFGDTLVLGSMQGPTAQRCLKTVAGLESQPGSDNVFMILTLLRP